MTGGVGTTIPAWFGSADLPLLGWWELPPGGGSRGAIVICPSMAQEHTSAYRALRVLAEGLAQRGIATFRFDYAGTGDSADPIDADADRVPRWLDSIEAAVGHARAVAGGPVAAVGVRLGALLLAAAVRERPLDLAAAVLWDPPPSGRSWLRRQTALHRMALSADARPDDGTELPGLALSAATAKGLSALAGVTPYDGPWPATLLLTADPSPAAPPTGEVQSLDETAQALLFDVEPAQARVPLDVLEVVVGWLDTQAPREFAPVHVPAASSAFVRGPAGMLQETAGHLEPRGVAGVRTETGERRADRTVVFLGASDHRVGPARQWVTWSRAWASESVRTVRLDVGGTGDGVRRGDEVRLRYYTEAAVADAIETIRVLEPDPTRVTVVGLCAGAWTAMRVAESRSCAHVVLVNQLVWARAAANLGPDDLVGGAESYHHSRVKRIRGRIRSLLPGVVGRLLDEAGVTNSPIARLAAISRRGVQATVVLATAEVPGFTALAGPHVDRVLARTGVMARLSRRRGRLSFVIVEDMDHAMLTAAGRAAADEVVREIALATEARPA